MPCLDNTTLQNSESQAREARQRVLRTVAGANEVQLPPRQESQTSDSDCARSRSARVPLCTSAAQSCMSDKDWREVAASAALTAQPQSSYKAGIQSPQVMPVESGWRNTPE